MNVGGVDDWGPRTNVTSTAGWSQPRIRLAATSMPEDYKAFRQVEWQPTSRWILYAWALSYARFLLYVFHSYGGFLFIDSANLVVHEGGHMLFGWLGPTLGIWGGTLLQWLVPFLLAAYFFFQRQIAGFAFCLFFFFENWMYTATYMADARAMVLPLVTTGDPDPVEHDWNKTFTSLGVLQYDTAIAGVIRFLGWCGMVGVVVWAVWRARQVNVERNGICEASTTRAFDRRGR